MRPSKIILFTILVLLVLLIAMIGINAIFGLLAFAVMSATGMDLDTLLGGWGGVLLVVLVAYLFPKDLLAWNRKYYIQGETIIDAPIEKVWDWMQIRERDDYFSSSTKKIRKIPGTRDDYQMMFDERLNDEDDDIPNHIHVRLLDEEPHEYMAYHVVNVEKMPLFGKDHLMTEVLLNQQEDGVRVRYIETLSRLTLGGFFALLFLNPARDSLRSLKAQMEGTQDPSLMNRVLQGMSDEGEPSDEVKRATHISGITAMVVVTAMTAGVIYVVSRLAVG